MKSVMASVLVSLLVINKDVFIVDPRSSSESCKDLLSCEIDGSVFGIDVIVVEWYRFKRRYYLF